MTILFIPDGMTILFIPDGMTILFIPDGMIVMFVIAGLTGNLFNHFVNVNLQVASIDEIV